MGTGALSPGVGYQGKGPALAHPGSWPGYSRSRSIRYDSPLLAMCSGIWCQTTVNSPSPRCIWGWEGRGNRAVGENSLQHVQKLLRPLELLAWLEPCGHMPDSDGLRT